jgi:hypothetical protein
MSFKKINCKSLSRLLDSNVHIFQLSEIYFIFSIHLRAYFLFVTISAIFMFEESVTQNVTFYQYLNCVDCCRVNPTSEFLVALIVIQLICSTMISIPVFNKITLWCKN